MARVIHKTFSLLEKEGQNLIYKTFSGTILEHLQN